MTLLLSMGLQIIPLYLGHYISGSFIVLLLVGPGIVYVVANRNTSPFKGILRVSKDTSPHNTHVIG